MQATIEPIEIVRGTDTEFLIVIYDDRIGGKYTLSENDIVRFTIAESDEAIVRFDATVENQDEFGNIHIVVYSEDTISYSASSTRYSYDVVLLVDGETPLPIIPISPLRLTDTYYDLSVVV